mmetsp:Transcript_3859/g.4461  ORF Transcript_3859/g.4461 Transcript_3859/m.4461 type:complete len:491 (+) Transcript_3859:88-1560(+)
MIIIISKTGWVTLSIFIQMELQEPHRFLRLLGPSPQDADWYALHDLLLECKEETKLDQNVLVEILNEILKVGSSDNPTLASIVKILLSMNNSIESLFPLDNKSVEDIISSNRFLTAPVVDEILGHFFRNTKEAVFEKPRHDAALKVLSRAIKCKNIETIKSIIHMFPNDWNDWRDAMGMTPLHIVFGYDMDTETNGNTNDDRLSDVQVINRSTILKFLLSAIMPKNRYRALLAKCHEGQGNALSTPMDCAIYYLNIQYKLKRQNECEDEWKCLQLCVEAAGEKFQIIHYCITLRLLSLHGELLSDMIVRLGDHANVEITDEYGKTPLLLAIQEHKVHYMRQLLLLNPNSAKRRMCYYDNNSGKWFQGRLPLHTAFNDSGHNGRLEWEGVTLILKASCANALRVQDPVTGLYPFMQAVCGRSNDRSSSLSDVYSLLLSDPSALQYCNQSTKNKTSTFANTFISILTIAVVLLGVIWELFAQHGIKESNQLR